MNNILDFVSNKFNQYLPSAQLPSQPSGLTEKLQHVENRLKGVNHFLKKTTITVKGKKVSLNTLPWYLLIGSTGAGKTSLLVNSGIKYILEKKMQRSNNQVMPNSEHCDWWATANAVLIDVPGNYTTYKPKRVSLSNRLWRHFLSLTKQLRGDQALSGVVIVISVSELLAMTERESLVKSLNYRINELRAQFGDNLPFYFTLTKCDLLPGFSEFFEGLGSNELSQAWGIPISQVVGESLANIFSHRFNRLIKRLNQQLIQRLHQERNIYTKLYIKDFPLQLERLKESFAELLNALAQDETPFHLKGVYLTSSTQQQYAEEFSPSRQMVVTDELQNALTIMQAPAMPIQAYFIRQFFLHVLASNEPPEQVIDSFKPNHIAYALIVSVFVIIAMTWHTDDKKPANKTLASVNEASVIPAAYTPQYQQPTTNVIGITPYNRSINERG